MTCLLHLLQIGHISVFSKCYDENCYHLKLKNFYKNMNFYLFKKLKNHNNYLYLRRMESYKKKVEGHVQRVADCDGSSDLQKELIETRARIEGLQQTCE